MWRRSSSWRTVSPSLALKSSSSKMDEVASLLLDLLFIQLTAATTLSDPCKLVVHQYGGPSGRRSHMICGAMRSWIWSRLLLYGSLKSSSTSPGGGSLHAADLQNSKQPFPNIPVYSECPVQLRGEVSLPPLKDLYHLKEKRVHGNAGVVCWRFIRSAKHG